MKDTLSQSARAEAIFQTARDASESEGIARFRANAFAQYETLPVPTFERSNLVHRSLSAFRVESAPAPGAWEALVAEMIGATCHQLATALYGTKRREGGRVT
ncbi:hypothetical protein [Ferroacidibacillus organovorans]|uniref:hypothetical protein n=1 Tax=Ferroacidibacillus organovorans TaxID=1765683 RepID=UPI0007A7F361|nr:hypothetical protein [Ferroacidibacillus organovorans]KYP80838.1 hypothetical protein AYJ22_01380 [Ferroacidibacillus organovorans]